MGTLSVDEPAQQLVVHDVDWDSYERFLELFAKQPGFRLTYDRGTLEIMSPLHEHESDADFLGRLVVVLTVELRLPIKAGRSTTYRKQRKQRGLEPDHSYWITHEPQVRGKRKIDLEVDPPPDLAIEVDVYSRSVDRMAIYAALRVPEVWRLEDERLTFHVLGLEGKYNETPRSSIFPFLAAVEVMPFLRLREKLDENAVVARFQDWVQQKLGNGQKSRRKRKRNKRNGRRSK